MKKGAIYLSVIAGAGLLAYFILKGAKKKISTRNEMIEGDTEDTGDLIIPDSLFPSLIGTSLTASPSVIQSKHFELSDFRSGDGVDVPTQYYGNLQELVRQLDVLRDELGVPIIITSGYRSPSRNAEIGGKKNSYHKLAMAADMTSVFLTPRKIKATIEKLIAEGKMKEGGIGLYPNFVHYDVRGFRSRW